MDLLFLRLKIAHNFGAKNYFIPINGAKKRKIILINQLFLRLKITRNFVGNQLYGTQGVTLGFDWMQP